MIQYRKGNLLDVQTGIIAHGCNCQGVMGSGVALAVRNKYPVAYDKYRYECMGLTDDARSALLGRYNIVPVAPGLWVANMFTQDIYGGDGQKYVSYDAIDACFASINTRGHTLNIPKIGAGLGGGDWNVIESIINHRVDNQSVIVWEL